MCPEILIRPRFVGIDTSEASADWIIDQKRIELLNHLNATLRPDETLSMRMIREAEDIVNQREADLGLGVNVDEARNKTDLDRLLVLQAVVTPDSVAREAISRFVCVARAWSITAAPPRQVPNGAHGEKISEDSEAQEHDPEDGGGDVGSDDGGADLSIQVAVE